MEESVIRAAMIEMRRFIEEALAGRPFDDVPPSELAAIHDAADAHIHEIHGVRGWDIAAEANALRLDPAQGPDFDAWRSLYSDLEKFAEAQSLADFSVYGEYAGDSHAFVSCSEKDERLVINNVQALLSGKPAYHSFEVTVNLLDSANALINSVKVKSLT